MKKKLHILFLPCFSIAMGGSLSILVLFNLPFLYEQDTSNFIKTIGLVFLIFSLLIAFTHKLLLISLRHIREWNKASIAIVASLTVFLTILIAATSTYYWAIPHSHHIKICYQADDARQNLIIQQISHTANGRIYSPKIFGHENYPIAVKANTCISGTIRTAQRWNGIIINIIQEKQGDDLLKVEINRRATNITIGETTSIEVEAGSNLGNPIYPELFASTILLIVKWVALAISALYLALFLFSITELILYPETHHVFSHRIFLIVVLIYFLGFGFLMTQHGGQPDQGKHNYYSQRYSETWLLPKDDPKSPFNIEGHEYLYYWINGAASKIYNTFDTNAAFSTHNLLWRLMSTLMSAGTVFYVYRLTSLLTGNKVAGALAGFFLSNTLMFVYVSGGVSYDNLMNLCSAAALYHLIGVLKGNDYVKNTALMGTWLGLGGIAKRQVALLAFIIFILWLLYSIRNIKSLRLNFSRANIILLVMLALSVGAFMEFSGGNLIKYQRVYPACSQVKSDEVCTRFSYRAKHRQEVNYKNLWAERNAIVGPFEYALQSWLFNMINGIWGIVSHKTFVPKFTTSLHGVLIIWAVLCTARYWERKNTAVLALCIVILSYVGYVFVMNYNNLLRYNFLYNYAVQGRYLFPVFSAFLAVMVNSFLSIRSVWLRRLTLALALILYFGGGLGTFIFRYSDIFISWRIVF